VAKDAALGEIHSLSDLGASVAMGALTSSIGLVTGGLGGAVGGKLAGLAACRLGAGVMGKSLAGALSGGVGGGVTDVAEQLMTTGRVSPKQAMQAVAVGALVGAVTGGTSRCHSFDPETPVVMDGGGTKPIVEVELGDKVLSTDPESGETEGKPVSILHHNEDADLADVTVKDTKTGTTDVLHTTWHHPFWNADKQQWTDAKDLKAGDKLRSPDGETTQTVAAVKVWTGLKWMDDLTVNDTHTYYVLAGNEPVLVHNNNDCDLADIAANHRVNANNGLGVKGGKNIAVMRSMIDGQSPTTGIATSGGHVNPGEVGMQASRQFTPPNPSRAHDSEVFLLEDLAQGLNPKSTGAIHIYSERTVCPSCGDVIDQFKAKFPGVKVHVRTGED
jgi:hypothetical protein